MGSGRRMIFTYGTLKRGFSNHRLMEDLIHTGDARFIGEHRTELRYPLVCGPYRVPFLLNMPGHGEHVWGEVYEVSDVGLIRMDELEGVSRSHYERLPVRLSNLDSEITEAYYAHRSYGEEMWKRNGEKGYSRYSEKEARGYIKRQDRPQHLTFLDQISLFLSNSVLPLST